MKNKHPHIDHQYDVWHLSKSVTKKLTKKANIKGNDDLTHWIKSISNHLWWCSASCNKNAEELVEKWKSILNQHHAFLERGHIFSSMLLPTEVAKS